MARACPRSTIQASAGVCFASLGSLYTGPYLPQPRFSSGPNCPPPRPRLACEPLKSEACHGAVDEMFFAQIEEFCRLVQQEFVARFNEVAEISNSSGRALAFAESLMLCPTVEAAQVCIRRELSGSLSFVLAIHAMQRQLQLGTLKLPTEAPKFQTRFYLLALTVREYLECFHAQPAEMAPKHYPR